MKRTTRSFLTVLACCGLYIYGLSASLSLFMAVAIPGLAMQSCASQTPAQKLFAARGSATIVARNINIAVQTGKISQKDNREILNPLIHQADKIFDQWEAALNTPGGSGGVDYFALVQGILDSIQKYLIAKEAAK